MQKIFFKQTILVLFSFLLFISSCADHKSSTSNPNRISTNTASYSIIASAEPTGFVEGKTTIMLDIKDQNTELPITGLSVTANAMMKMASSANHSTPVGNCIEKIGGYSCVVYFLMSTESNNIHRGDWTVNFMIGSDNEKATIYPNVMKAGLDTVQVRLKGIADKIPAMGGGEESRIYHIFLDNITNNASNYDLTFYISARESMMKFSALKLNSIYNTSTSNQLTVSSIVVEGGKDKNSLQSLTDNNDGTFTLSNIALTTGSQDVYIALSVNNEQKTTNGEAASSSNREATFTITR